MRTAILTAALTIVICFTVTSCKKLGDSVESDGWNNVSATEQISRTLNSRFFEIPYPHRRYQCSEYFTVGSTVIVDRSERDSPVGALIQVVSETRVTANQDIRGQTFVGMNCYGSPYSAGQTKRYIESFYFSKWQSGWKLEEHM